MKKQEINILNVFFCIMVIFIHASGAVVSGPEDSLAYMGIFPIWNLFSVAVPGFIFLSGLKSGLNQEEFTFKSYGVYVANKFKKIYFPYVLWVILYYLWFISQGYFPFSVSELVKYILNGTLAAHFYFVIIIMQFYMLFPVVKRVVKRFSPALILLSSLIISYFSEKYLSIVIYDITKVNFIYTDRLFTTYLVYYAFGLICAQNYEKVLNTGKNKWLIAFCALLAIVFCVSFRTPYYQISKLMFCLNIIPCLLAFSSKISTDGFFKSKFFKCVNSATFNIYLSHLLFMQIIDTYIISAISGRLLVAFCIRLLLLLLLSFLYSYFKKHLRRRNEI